MKGKYIGVENSEQFPETLHTQQVCWHTFAHCVHYLLHHALIP